MIDRSRAGSTLGGDDPGRRIACDVFASAVAGAVAA